MTHEFDSSVDGSGSDSPLSGASTDVLDTLELRWFSRGTIPSFAMQWFIDAAPHVDVERRVDSYLLTGRSDLGVKRRDRGPVEVKVRLEVGERVDVGTRLSARAEEWRKYHDESFLGFDGRWVDIEKTVTTFRYRTEGRGGSASACDVELAGVEVDGFIGWTFALEASGPRPDRRGALIAAFEEFLSGSEVPVEIATTLDFEAGYPAWIVHVIGPGVGPPVR